MGTGLEGIKVIQTAAVMAGPMAGRLLADWGADVIRVDPVGGEMLKTLRDRMATVTEKTTDVDFSAENFNRNKRAIALDLAQEDGRNILLRLLKGADVLISNFRPRDIEKFKLDYTTLSKLNPRLISAGLTGYGKKGPDKDLPAYGIMGFITRTGLQHLLEMPGAEPVTIPVALPDIVTGTALAYGIMTALYIREKTGKGQEVDTSLFRTGVFCLSDNISEALVTGLDQQQLPRIEQPNVTRNFFQTKDGRWLRLSLLQAERFWAQFCRAIERPDLINDPRFSKLEALIQNRIPLFHIIVEAFLRKTLVEWKVRLDKEGVPWAAVQTLPEVIADSQARANDFYIPYNHPVYGQMEMVGNPVTLGDYPEKVRLPAPQHGQHTDEVLLEYGYSRTEVKKLREKHIVA